MVSYRYKYLNLFEVFSTNKQPPLLRTRASKFSSFLRENRSVFAAVERGTDAKMDGSRWYMSNEPKSYSFLVPQVACQNNLINLCSPAVTSLTNVSFPNTPQVNQENVPPLVLVHPPHSRVSEPTSVPKYIPILPKPKENDGEKDLRGQSK